MIDIEQELEGIENGYITGLNLYESLSDKVQEKLLQLSPEKRLKVIRYVLEVMESDIQLHISDWADSAGEDEIKFAIDDLKEPEWVDSDEDVPF